MNKKTNLILALLTAVFLFACDPWEDHVKNNSQQLGQNIYEVIKSDPNLSTFARIIEICGYDSVLSTGNSFTVFAIDNDNFGVVTFTDTVYWRGILRNHIAYLSYGITNGTFQVDYIKMINGKYNSVDGNNFGDAVFDKLESNRICGNGILHLVNKPVVALDNIWETLSKMNGFDQIDFIKSINTKLMDMDRSIQIGFNANSQPIYDTVFLNVNQFLDNYTINNEDRLYTFVLLNNDVFGRLKKKYSKYFTYVPKDSLVQRKTINFEICKDMTLMPVSINANGMKCASVNGIEIDLSKDSIVSTLQTSNGTIYVMNGANVHMYENKIKTTVIEAENYSAMYSQRSSEAAIRIRSFASGGMDVMLSGWSRMYTYLNGAVVTQSPYGNLTDVGTLTRTWNYSYNTNLYSNVSNAYFEYHPLLYTVPYKIYWVAYDDIASHYSGFADTLQPVFELEQKMFVSFAGRSPLTRGGAGEITNNFSSATLFAGVSNAGERKETRLMKYSTDGTTQMLLYKVVEPDTLTVAKQITNQLVVPYFGTAKVWVTNSPRAIGQYSGMIFLDYIKFQPVIDPNE